MNLITKIFKKNKAYKDIPSPTTSFDSVINLTEAYLENKSDSDKIVILDYVIDILKVDICSSGIVEPLHTNDIIVDVDDFRLATIYELAKKRFFIKTK